jgi:YD repeat-containing protein
MNRGNRVSAATCLCGSLLLAACASRHTPTAPVSAAPALEAAPPATDAQKAGFAGPVSIVVWNTSPFERQGQGFQESARRSLRTVRYDEHGRLLEDGTLTERTALKYDPLGQLALLRQYRGSELRSSTAYFYDARGRAVLEETKDPGGTLVAALSYRYDAAGRLAEKTARAATGETQKTWTFAYDPQGRLIDETAHTFAEAAGPGGRLEYRIVCEYDERGRKTGEKLYTHPGGPDSVTRYTYGPSGAQERVTEEQYLVPDNVLLLRRTDRFDASGNLIRSEEETFAPGGAAARSSTTTYEYEFDTFGNWKKLTALCSTGGQAPKVAQVIQRTISYHNQGGGIEIHNLP